MSVVSSSLFTQHARLIKLHTPLPENTLLVEHFCGEEAVSKLFRFEIDCLSTDAFIDVIPLIGETVSLQLLLADGSYRTWHGHITRAFQLGADGGFARYRLIIEPWLAFLRSRRDNYLFQDKTVLDVATQVFAEYPIARWSQTVTRNLRTYSRLTQYRESDFDFICRLLAEEGLWFYFKHEVNAENTGHHELVICDSHSDLAACPQSEIRFHRAHATEENDTLQIWRETREALPNAVSFFGWDYKKISAVGLDATSLVENGDLPRMELFEGSEAYRFQNNEEARDKTDLALMALEAKYQRFEGESTVRALAAAQTFTLTDHDNYSGEHAEFTVSAIKHIAANNLDASIREQLSQSNIENGTYRNQILAQPKARPMAPKRLEKPTAPMQTALVVGLADAAHTTDRDHRVKIQFHWQRGEKTNAGGHSQTGSTVGEKGKKTNAPGNEQSGTWVRVAEWLAGPNWGSHFLPRLGTEVLVDFISGNIDRPIVVGQLYNGADAPPFAAGHNASANHPGVLSGWMSHNFADGFNQWVTDDSPGQVRTRLATSEQASQLSLGYLIHQNPASATRGNWRGTGFEWRTDGWTILRAGTGMLLSSTARTNATSTQMDVAEAVAQLKAAEQTATALSDAATAQNALPLKANTSLTKLITQIDAAQEGKYAGTIAGQAAKKAQAGSRSLGDATERFAAPWIVSESPSDIGITTPASILAFASENMHATVQSDWHLAATNTFSAAVGGGASWFSHSGGIKSIAAAGTHTIQAHTDAMEILADQSITLTSSNDEIHIYANDKIVLQAADSAITLEGGNITCASPGKFCVKGSQHALLGGSNNSPNLAELPAAQLVFPSLENYGIQLDVGSFFSNDPELAGGSYEIWAKGEQPSLLGRGKLNEIGRSALVNTPSAGEVEIIVGDNEWFDVEELQLTEEPDELVE